MGISSLEIIDMCGSRASHLKIIAAVVLAVASLAALALGLLSIGGVQISVGGRSWVRFGSFSPSSDEKAWREMVLRRHPNVTFLGELRERRAVYRVRGEWGLIDEKGNFVTPPVFDMIWDVHHGHVMVMSGEKTGLIDIEGNVVVLPDAEIMSVRMERSGEIVINYRDGRVVHRR